MDTQEQSRLLHLTGDIVTAFLSKSQISASGVPGLIKSTFDALVAADSPANVDVESEKPVPVVSIRKSTSNPDHILSLIDGKPYKMLKKHLALHGYTPESYRAAYGLPLDYPMTAASYTEQRRNIAHKIGLGKGSTPAPKSDAEIAIEEEEAHVADLSEEPGEVQNAEPEVVAEAEEAEPASESEGEVRELEIVRDGDGIDEITEEVA